MSNQTIKPDKLTQEQQLFQEWLQHPVTEQLRKWAKEQRQERMEQWANGDFFASFDSEMTAKNAGAAAACSVYSQIMELEFEVIYGK